MKANQLLMRLISWFMGRGIAPNQITIATAIVAFVSYLGVPCLRGGLRKIRRGLNTCQTDAVSTVAATLATYDEKVIREVEGNHLCISKHSADQLKCALPSGRIS
jgi:hypothetical protein